MWTLLEFMAHTKDCTASFKADHTPFLADIGDDDRQALVATATVAKWIENMTKDAGIDTTVYKPHCIRSATSTRAVKAGISIDRVETHAHWSAKSNTF